MLSSIVLDRHQRVTGQRDPGADPVAGFGSIRPDLEHLSRRKTTEVSGDQWLENAARETVCLQYRSGNRRLARPGRRRRLHVNGHVVSVCLASHGFCGLYAWPETLG